jgi:hypothetical protein
VWVLGVDVFSTRFSRLGRSGDVVDSIHGDEPGELADSSDTNWVAGWFLFVSLDVQPLKPMANAAAQNVAANTSGKRVDRRSRRPSGRRCADRDVTYMSLPPSLV